MALGTKEFYIMLPCLWILVEAMTDPCLLSNHTYTSIDGKICHCCAPGFFKKADCTQNGEQARCQSCGKGNYSSTYNQAVYCRPCSCEGLCLRDNTVLIQNCSLTSNYVYQCATGFHFIPRAGSNGDGDCIAHSPCDAGYEREEPGTVLKNTMCRECSVGTFSNTSSFDADACRNCSRCVPPDVILQKCSTKADTICGGKEDMITPKPQNEDDGKPWILPVTLASVAACLLIIFCIIFYCLRKHNMESLPFVQKVNFFQICFPVESGDTELEPVGNDANIPLQHTEHAERYDPPTTEQLEGACKYNPDQENNRTEYACYGTNNGVSQSSSKLASDGKTFAQLEREWTSMFNWLSKEMPVDVWKSVIRNLFAVSESEDKADNVIEEVIEDNQNKVREQIYQCLTQWRKKRGTKEWKLSYIVAALQANEQNKLVNDLKSKWHSLEESNV